MTKEEIENGTADMEIDQRELMNGERSELNAVPEGFNASYLKVYYDNDIYLRFQSFNSASQLENSIKEKCPFKIDIGPVYSVD
ncbi:dna primase small subunit, partial [Quercus suber]